MHNLPVIEKPFRLHKQEQMSKEYKENFNAMSRVRCARVHWFHSRLTDVPV
jgi:hypothetical protein